MAGAVVKGLYQKRGWFYFQPSTPAGGGKRPAAVALGTTDLVEAIQLLEEKRQELLEWTAARRMTFAEVLPAYYEAKKKDSVLTRRQRVVVLDGFAEIMGNPRVDAVTPEMIGRWREHVEKHGARKHARGRGAGGGMKAAEGGENGDEGWTRSASTMKTYLIALKAFFNWAVERGMIRESPMKGMKREVRFAKTRRQEFLSEEQRERLLAEEMPDHIRFILLFGFLAGMRDGEMLAMAPHWLWIEKDWSRGTVTVQNQRITRTDGSVAEWRPKKRECRTIPLHPRLLEFLKDYGIRSPWMLRPDKALWPLEEKHSKRYDAHKALRNLGKRCGIKGMNYHILRHTFATHLVMKGVSLAEVAGLLGDTLKVTEDSYAGYCPSRANPLSVL